MNKQKNKPKKEKTKKKLSGVDKLLAGSQDVEFLPDGRLKAKGKKEKGVKLESHTFYCNPTS